MYSIHTLNLTKKYSDLTAVDNLNLQIKHGEIFALLGVNGAGKSTVINMLSCLSKPTFGDALICGYSINTDGLKVKSIIGVSPQETAVAPNLTARENLQLICGAYGFSTQKTNEKIGELTTLLGLESVIKKRAGKLSGGWQRKLSIAMALVGEPKVLFLDEPTLGLDILARTNLWSVIRSLKGKATIILTTHYLEEAESLSDRIGILKDGKLLKVGTAEQLTLLSGEPTFEKAFVKLAQGVSL